MKDDPKSLAIHTGRRGWMHCDCDIRSLDGSLRT